MEQQLIENLQKQIDASVARLEGMKRGWAATERNILEGNDRIRFQIAQLQERINNANSN
jgi:hypothetical protein